MQQLFILLVQLVFIFSAYAQPVVKTDYAFTDNFAKGASGKNAKDLSWYLAGPFVNNEQKVRAFFTWIASNIEYDVENYRNLDHIYQSIEYPNKFVEAAKNDSLYSHLIADLVIKRKKGICDGYARLFKTMCDYERIPCVLITGYADWQVELNSSSKYTENHAWNAVYINKKWKLIDVTWASGYCDETVTTYTKLFEPAYFFADPSFFYKHHLPTNLSWLSKQLI
jgi:transglutaminase/protease-like cytokinesis protein 3